MNFLASIIVLLSIYCLSAALQQLHGSENAQYINNEIAEMEKESTSTISFPSRLVPALFITVTYRLVQQWCHVIIGSKSPFNNHGERFFLITCQNAFVSVVGFFAMHSINRRPLLLTSTLFTAITILVVALYTIFSSLCHFNQYYLNLTIHSFYLFITQIAFNPMSYFIGADLLNTEKRSYGTAAGSVAGFSINIVLVHCSEAIMKFISDYHLLIPTFGCFTLYAMLFFLFPETQTKRYEVAEEPDNDREQNLAEA